jgi:uncharacterized membrane protein YgaE (UPF0421/DUF939 family)
MGSILSPIIGKDNPLTIEHSARTAVAAVVSLFVARWFGLPESYWAAITTLVVMQSTLGAALPVSAQRLAGTALGAAVGALAGAYYPGNALVFGGCILILGIVFVPFRLDRNAYRYASITLAMIMLVPGHSGWIVALHRFFEVSVGIAVGLAMSALWPER